MGGGSWDIFIFLIRPADFILFPCTYLLESQGTTSFRSFQCTSGRQSSLACSRSFLSPEVGREKSSQSTLQRSVVCLEYFGTGELHLPGIQEIFRGRIQSLWVEKEDGRFRCAWATSLGLGSPGRHFGPRHPWTLLWQRPEETQSRQGVGQKPGISTGSPLEVLFPISHGQGRPQSAAESRVQWVVPAPPTALKPTPTGAPPPSSL